jgi:hypothetical protein
MATVLLGRRRKRRAVAADRACLACHGSTGSTWKWLCDACFALLPFARKKEICEARAERAPHRVFGLSRGAAEWLQDRRARQAEAN